MTRSGYKSRRQTRDAHLEQSLWVSVLHISAATATNRLVELITDRHERRGCWKRLDQEHVGDTTMGDIFEEVPPYAASEERSEEDEERNQDKEEEEDSDSDSDMVIESEDEDVSDREMDDQGPWKTLRQEVEESLSSTYDKKVNKFLKEGVSETIAEANAFNALLPVYRRKLRGLYLHYLQWFERLKHDPMYKDVMKTGHRFMEEDSMDVKAAAVERRKSLLNRMFQPRPIPTQDEEEQNDDDK